MNLETIGRVFLLPLLNQTRSTASPCGRQISCVQVQCAIERDPRPLIEISDAKKKTSARYENATKLNIHNKSYQAKLSIIFVNASTSCVLMWRREVEFVFNRFTMILLQVNTRSGHHGKQPPPAMENMHRETRENTCEGASREIKGASPGRTLKP